jgi:long-chain acyl-CoA synthetase
MDTKEDTINDVFRNRVQEHGDRIAVEKKLKGKWESATWNEYYERARSIGLGLYSLGIRKGQMVSILSDNRLEWIFTDMGTLGIGAVAIPIYITLTAEEIRYILDNSDTRVIVLEDRNQLSKVLEIFDQCKKLEKIVVMEKGDKPAANDSVISFNELMEMGTARGEEDPELFEKLSKDVGEEDLATIVYTSGTTGVPKGAMISHGNIMWVVRALHRVEPHYATSEDSTVPFLPLSHVFERIAGHFYGMYNGITSSYAGSIETLLEDFAERRPTMILAVPRVCEKVYQRIMAQVQEQSALKQKIFYWGQKVGGKISILREQKKRIPFWLKLKFKIAYSIIFKKLQQRLGGRVTWMTASGGPTAEEIIRFFNAAGITVIQGYGMTECTAPATMQSLDDYRIGTAGKPLPGMDIKIADDGEILLKGGNVIKGYWKMPDETKESFTSDGYLMSGDIGIFDDDGNLLITDRKKDLIITSGGKNVAPQKIENLFKADPLFTQFIVIGESKKYLSGICNINLEEAERLANEAGLSFNKPEDLLENEDFIKIIQEHVDDRNKHLAQYETIKKWKIVKTEFSQEGGELTPSLKVKRKVVQEKYRELIAALYDREAVDELYEKGVE